ncbi:MAG: hypothetical protein HWE14_08955 [Flavobacteriia bacterium]|nr:hypothetical protein [Flavobacteriia bacterium]
MRNKNFYLALTMLLSAFAFGQNDDIVVTIQNQNQDSTNFTFDIYASTTAGTTYLGDADIALSTAGAKWSSLAVSHSNVDAKIGNFASSIVSGNIILNIGGNLSATSTSDFPALTTTPTRIATITLTDVSDFTATPDLAFLTTGSPKTLIYEVYTSGSRLRQRKINTPTLQAPAAGITPAAAVTNFVADLSTVGQADLTWDAATDSVLIIARAGSAVATGPINTVGYNANSVFNDGDQINVSTSREYVVGKYDGSATSATVTGLASGTTYHFAIYKFSGGNGRTEAYGASATASGTGLEAEPTTIATDIDFDNITPTSFDIAWTQGDGDSVLVVLRVVDSARVAPTDGEGYTASTDFSNPSDSTGNGNYVLVYAPNNGSLSVTGLTAGLEYSVEIYEFNGSGASANYLTSSYASATQYSQFDEPSTTFAGVTVNAVTANGIEVTWTDPSESDNRWLVVARLSTDAATAPGAGDDYTADTAYGSGEAIGNGFVVYNGDGTSGSVTIGNLDQNETYAFDVYAYTGGVASDSAVLNYSDATDGNGSAVTWMEASVIVLLEGPYDGSDMASVNITVPSSQPYNQAPWNYGGSESNGSLPANVVDWVLLELRTSASGSENASTVAFTQAALLLDDGSIVAADGTSTPIFELSSEDDYYIAVRHRNHLAVSSDTVLTDGGKSAFSYNFSTAGASGTEGMYDYNGDGSLYLMYAGWVDPTTDATINAGDYSAVYTDRNNTSATYDFTDANMDGLVDSADRAAVFNNRDYAEQLP